MWQSEYPAIEFEPAGHAGLAADPPARPPAGQPPTPDAP